ncbi:putative ribonuclease H-like domain-containing protein [Tanacetum coccineum]|uniref:Ribonuclease H-like domain-containing protein n=1 Tax=Tanacetum coccineum TaxID=301880 RepID=A0ABQ5DFY8_9ASTR
MWEMRIKQYFQVQDYALWEVIENGNSWVSVPQTTQENGVTVTKNSVPVTAEEKINKKNDVKARSLLLMALPNEHLLTFSKYSDAKTLYDAIKTRFGGNEATKKTQKALLKQQYENFNASSSESLDSIFNRLQKIVSRLAILGVVITPEDLNSKFLRSLPPEWNTHVVVWMNKDDIETMSIDDLYNNFKIVEQEVKKSVGGSTSTQNMAFMTAQSTRSTNNVNTANPDVSTVSTNVNTASPKDSTATLSDATVYAFLANQPNGSQLVHEDLEQIHDDDLEEMDLKWQLALLSMRARKFYQRTGKKITINGSDTTGYDKSKVECFNCHKMGHFARECRNPRNQDSSARNHDSWNKNQDVTRKTVNVEETSSKAMLAINGVGFDWSDMAEEQVQTNMALMAFSDSEVYTDKSCSKTCLKNYKSLKKQCDDLLVKLNETEFKAATYKKGCKDYEIGMLKTEYEKVKQEKEGIDFKIAKFDKSAKSVDEMLGSQITDKSKKGLGYNAVSPPHPLIYNRPTQLDLSYSGLDEFKQPEFNRYGPRNTELKTTINCDKESDNSKENTDDSLEKEQVTDNESSSVESPLKFDKETVIDWKEIFFHPAEKVESVKPKNNEKPVKKTVRYAEMYRSQSPRGNQRNWNGQKSNQLGSEFVMYNKACYGCGSFDHIQINCPNHQRKRRVTGNNYNKVDYDYYSKTSHPSSHRNMTPRAVLLKTGLKPLSTARPVYTAQPKPTVQSARPMTYFSKQAQSTVQMPFYKKTALTNRYFNQKVNTARPRVVNTARPYRAPVNIVRANGFNVVKPSACWVWRPTRPNGASLGKPQMNDKGFVDSGCSRHMTGNIAYLTDFKEFNGGYVTFGGGAYGGRITGKGTLKTDSLDFEDVHYADELKFILFSVSQMCDKKNYVLFTDTECLVLSPNFKLPDESQILLRIPREDNMYSFDMKNIVPKESLTCLVAKATSDESMLWHRRLGHINFKNINKLVKENLVRGLPLKPFENDQTCVACLKGKQHRASCKSKVLNPITKHLFMLHMDLFGPTFISSLMHKKYCLVVTDDYSRFTWVFFLVTKDETSEILKNFIIQIENLVDQNVKIIRCDNGTEFKNKVMDDFCKEKGIRREYSVARNPQKNGVAERRNRTLLKAARTMLADSKLLTTFWAEAVSTACYVQNRVLIVKPHNKTPYELFRGKFDGKSDAVTACTSTNESADASYFDSPSKQMGNDDPKSVDKKDGIFISQDKYVDEILRKFNYTDVKSASTPVDLEKPLVKDGEMVLIFQVTPKTSHLLAMKRIFRYLKGKPGLWYSRDSPFELVAYTDSDYAGATQDRKSTTGGCQFLGNRLISWQCKKQTVVATSTTEVEYVAAASCCGQVGDEVVYKELGDRMERATTTASSLEAEQDIEFSDKHNMVAYLEKSEGSEGFYEIIDFLNSSHIKYALTKNPTIYVSFIKQFWRTATANTRTDGKVELTATIDGHVKTITEASLRRHLKWEDNDGVTSLPNSEIFEQIAPMGYVTDFDKLTFQKGNFSPQWRFLIHIILHCITLKKTSWEQFSSNVATTIICLAINRTYNFSKMIFDAMVKNVESPHKFLMYPRFIQICLDMQKKHLQPHTRTYDAHLLTNKVFSNMKRLSKGYTGVEVPLFPSMLNAPSTSPSRITSSPSLSPEPSPLPQHTTTNMIKVLEKDLQQTKKTYSTAFTKLIFRVKKLEKQVKSGKARRRARSVLSEDEDAAEDSSKQGRKISDIDEDPNEKQSDDTEVLIEEEEPNELVEDQGSSRKDEREVSTAGAELSIGKNGVNTSSGSISTAAVSTANEIDTDAAKKAKEKRKSLARKRTRETLDEDTSKRQKLDEEEQLL